MFRQKKISLAVWQALSLSVAAVIGVSAMAQTATTEKTVITGSNIKRVDAEGPAPVEVMTREDIVRTGATTLNELIKYIPTIDKYDQGEVASNSPAGSGTSTLRMRGLSETNVLVLLNGRRLPVNAIYDASGAGAAVDINMIPASAIERVEILKDGGSAIYGADAVAGVVNFITRKDYQGVEVAGRYGISSRHDGVEKGGSIAAGFGDYAKSGFNVLFALDVFRRDPILRKDREISSSVDYRRYGLTDGRSSFAPQGNYLFPDGSAFTGESVVACPPELYRLRCRYDFNASLLTNYNGADRIGGMLVGALKVSNNLKATFQLNAAQAKDHFEAHPVPDFFVVPSGTGLIAGRFMQGGPRITDRKSTLLDGNLGLEGTTKWFEWDVAAGYGESKVTNKDKNYYNANLWVPATESGALNPTILTNDAAFVESLKVSPVREGKSTVKFLDLRMRGEAFSLPAGPLGWAAGASLTKEGLQDRPDALSLAGLVVGSIQQSGVDATRTGKAVFAEVSVPVLKTLEVQGAVRYDQYPNDSKMSPKAAVLWKPLRALGLRASYTQSFRVPSLKQLFGALEEGAGNISEDQDCILLGVQPPCDIAFFLVQGANPNLKPEKGKTYNFGVITEAGPFSATIDYWRIDKEDGITTPTITSALQQGLFSRDPVTQRLLVFLNLQNVAQSRNEGVDVDMRLKVPIAGFGNFTLREAATYYIKQRTREAGEEWAEFNGTYALPRWKHIMLANLESAKWGANIIYRVTAGFTDTPNPWTQSSPLPASIRKVGKYEEWDVSGYYTGLKNFRFDVGVKNVLDRAPPLSQTNAVNNQYEQVGYAPLYNSRGRFFFTSLTYTLK